MDERTSLCHSLRDVLARVELAIDEQMIKQFVTYLLFLREQNRIMNLTAITDDEGMSERHILDSLMPLSLLPFVFPDGASLVDVGTGAGFPGLPLKIVRPDLNLSLFDALAKRTRFLREAVDKIGISDVRILHTRAEEAARKEPDRDAFDVSIARAVAPLSVLAEYCLPLVRPGGYFIAMKGDVRDELEAADGAWSALGGEFEQTLSFVLPGTTMRRSLVVVRKISSTPNRFPRSNAQIRKKPLC